MGILKEIAVRGAYYIETGTKDFNSWSKLMTDEVGSNVRPYLKEVMQWSLIISQRKAGAQSMKRNCWEFCICEKHENGASGKKNGACPAYMETGLNGIHGGKNGGRACWLIEGTKCGGTIKRILIPKSINCRLCGFKKAVLNEEKQDLAISDDFIKMLIH